VKYQVGDVVSIFCACGTVKCLITNAEHNDLSMSWVYHLKVFETIPGTFYRLGRNLTRYECDVFQTNTYTKEDCL